MTDDSTVLRPFILACCKDAKTHPVSALASTTADALRSVGFTIAGMYNVSEACIVLVITNSDLQAVASQTERGGFGAALRVGITQVGLDEVQVTFTNPKYMAFAYRMASADVAMCLEASIIKALGGIEKDYGCVKGLTEKKLRKYQYKIGMEYFDEPETLGKCKTHEEAVAMVEANIAKQSDVINVCRIDIPGKKEVLFCVGLQSKTDKFANDCHIMSKIDTHQIKHTPHMPYEVLVSDYKVLMLHARFRIAVNFPDLDMMGAGSFMEIMDAPKAIKKALAVATCGSS